MYNICYASVVGYIQDQVVKISQVLMRQDDKRISSAVSCFHHIRWEGESKQLAFDPAGARGISVDLYGSLLYSWINLALRSFFAQRASRELNTYYSFQQYISTFFSISLCGFKKQVLYNNVLFPHSALQLFGDRVKPTHFDDVFCILNSIQLSTAAQEIYYNFFLSKVKYRKLEKSYNCIDFYFFLFQIAPLTRFICVFFLLRFLSDTIQSIKKTHFK